MPRISSGKQAFCGSWRNAIVSRNCCCDRDCKLLCRTAAFLGSAVSSPCKVWGFHRRFIPFQLWHLGEATVISFCKLFSDCDESFLFVLEQRWHFNLFYDPEYSYLASKNLFVGKIKMVQSWAPEGSACTHHQHTDTSRPSPPGTHTSVEFLHSLPQSLPAHPYSLGAAFYPDQETFTWVHLDQTEENSEQKEDLHVLKFP